MYDIAEYMINENSYVPDLGTLLHSVVSYFIHVIGRQSPASYGNSRLAWVIHGISVISRYVDLEQGNNGKKA